MPKTFRDLSTRQKNRRLAEYERQEREHQIHHIDGSIVTVGVNLKLKMADLNVPLKECDSPNGTSSENDLNILSADIPSSYDIIVEQDNKNVRDDIYKNQDFSNWLCSWQMKHNITHAALSDLLSKLRTYGHISLPNDARTLLYTPRITNVKIFADNKASFFHYGLRKAVIEQLARTNFIVQNKVILIDLNIDGLPISKSSKSQIWPILSKIYGDKAFIPFVINAYYGYSKPSSVHDFL